MDRSSLVAVRTAIPEDVNFILATWLRGLYYGDSWFSQIPKDDFMKNYHRCLEALLSRPNLQVRIACLKDDPEVILGYSVSEGSRLHWVFVKAAWRKIGIGKSLLPLELASVTHLTKVGQSLLKKLPGVTFNPFF